MVDTHPVGAGLLANALGHSIHPRLTSRIRQQAGSHGLRPETDRAKAPIPVWVRNVSLCISTRR
jgi:hypothetical protein